MLCQRQGPIDFNCLLPAIEVIRRSDHIVRGRGNTTHPQEIYAQESLAERTILPRQKLEVILDHLSDIWRCVLHEMRDVDLLPPINRDALTITPGCLRRHDRIGIVFRDCGLRIAMGIQEEARSLETMHWRHFGIAVLFCRSTDKRSRNIIGLRFENHR